VNKNSEEEEEVAQRRRGSLLGDQLFIMQSFRGHFSHPLIQSHSVSQTFGQSINQTLISLRNPSYRPLIYGSHKFCETFGPAGHYDTSMATSSR
jgi:hypothetical protein